MTSLAVDTLLYTTLTIFRAYYGSLNLMTETIIACVWPKVFRSVAALGLTIHPDLTFSLCIIHNDINPVLPLPIPSHA